MSIKIGTEAMGSQPGLVEAASQATGFVQPWMIPLAGAGIRGLYSLISPDRQSELLAEVLEGQTAFRNALARRAFGKMTPAETQEVKRGAEGQVNAVAGTVASRGLGSSAAGAEVVADAQQDAFAQARQEALAALPAHDQAIFQNVQSLFESDTSFNEDLSAVIKLLATELQENPDNKDPEVFDMIRTIWEALGSPIPQGT